MPKFAANLTLMFAEYPLEERFSRAADAGFQGVEVLFPLPLPASRMRELCDQNGLSVALINCPSQHAGGAFKCFGAVPSEKEKFREDFRTAAEYAASVGAMHIHIMAGFINGADAEECFVENLQWAADFSAGQSLTIEPLNPTDQPGYFLNDYEQASRILSSVKRANVSLQFDAYHAQMIGGDPLGAWARHGHLADHIQIAGVPGRHEPTGGGIDYPSLFSAILDSGYDGWVSGEYNPAGRTEDGLDWLNTPGF